MNYFKCSFFFKCAILYFFHTVYVCKGSGGKLKYKCSPKKNSLTKCRMASAHITVLASRLNKINTVHVLTSGMNKLITSCLTESFTQSA